MEEITKEEHEQLKTFVCSLNTVSTAIIQSAFKWKYIKTAHALDVLEKDKIVGPVKYDGEDAYRDVLQYKPQIKKL